MCHTGGLPLRDQYGRSVEAHGLEARFWSEAHVQEADFPSKWTRAGIPRAQFLVSGETAELPRMRASPMCLVHRIAGGKSRIAERLS